MSRNTVETGLFRLHYPFLAEARDYNGNKDFKYSMLMVFEDKTQASSLLEARKQIMQSDAYKKFSNQYILQNGMAVDKKTKRAIPFHDCFKLSEEKLISVSASQKTTYNPDGANCYTVADLKKNSSASRLNQQRIKDEMYAGCYCVAYIVLNFFDIGSCAGISAYIDTVFKVKEGEKIEGNATEQKESVLAKYRDEADDADYIDVIRASEAVEEDVVEETKPATKPVKQVKQAVVEEVAEEVAEEAEDPFADLFEENSEVK